MNTPIHQLNQEIRDSYIETVRYVVPFDPKEEAVQLQTIEWINDGEPVTKGQNPRRHLGAVAFITTREMDRVFLINHRKAQANLMPGGHVDYGDTLQHTIETELIEELGLEVDMSNSMPFYIADVFTRGSNAGHHDITAVFKVEVDPEQQFNVHSKEASDAGWFSMDQIASMPEFTILPDIHKKLTIGKYVFLDNGGVVSDDHCKPFHDELAIILGIDEIALKKLLSEKTPHGRAYRENAISRDEFWSTVLTLACASPDLDYSKLEILWAESYQLNSKVVEVIKRYRNAGIKMGLISNSDIYRKNHMLNVQKQKDLLDYHVVSCDVGVTKPEKKIFETAISLTGSTPNDTLYFDDRDTHVAAALESGMQGKIFDEVEKFEEDIKDFYRGNRFS